MNIWLSTDTHFGHDKMIELCGRPPFFSELILQGFRKHLKSGDTLIHLGDICLGNDTAWHLDLEGYIPEGVKRVLVTGNHDHKSDNWYLTHGWDFVCSAFANTYFGRRILFSHRPIDIPLGVKIGDINIHGHMHNNDHRADEAALYYNPKYHKRLAIEETDYLPVRLDRFIQTL